MAEVSSPSKSDSRNPRGNKKPIVCSYFLKGNCLFGDYCFNIHHVPDSSKDDQLDCGICLEAVLGKETPSQRQFALLENCDHVFCIECIRNWKIAQNDRELTCPSCRTPFSNFAASAYFVSNSAEKAKLLNDGKQGRSDGDEFTSCPFRCAVKEYCPYCDPRNRNNRPRPSSIRTPNDLRIIREAYERMLGSYHYREERLYVPSYYTCCVRQIMAHAMYSHHY